MSARQQHRRRAIAVANQKGGVGKTTTAINLGVALVRKGKRVLVIDMDPQANATLTLGLVPEEQPATILEVLQTTGTELPLAEVITDTEYGIDVIPANIFLAGAEQRLGHMMERERLLRKRLRPSGRLYSYADSFPPDAHGGPVSGADVHPNPPVTQDRLDAYDFVLLDCPPSLGLLTINALTYADWVLVPLQAQLYAVKGLTDLLGTVEMVRGGPNPDLALLGILLTMYDPRAAVSPTVAGEVKTAFPGRVFQAVINQWPDLQNMAVRGPILSYRPRHPGVRAYDLLAEEVIAHVGD